MSTLPDLDQVLSLPASSDQRVAESVIDVNGHMNITEYFRVAAWAPWARVQALGVDEDYLTRRGLSFFTVEHRIRYLSELRLGERYSAHAGLAGRTAKALHALAFVVDREHERVAATMEIMYVHVSMSSRRSVEVPEDVAPRLDAEIAAHPWVAEAAGGLSLRR